MKAAATPAVQDLRTLALEQHDNAAVRGIADVLREFDSEAAERILLGELRHIRPVPEPGRPGDAHVDRRPRAHDLPPFSTDLLAAPGAIGRPRDRRSARHHLFVDGVL